jgi:hypothetical protein
MLKTVSIKINKFNIKIENHNNNLIRSYFHRKLTLIQIDALLVGSNFMVMITIIKQMKY